MTSMPDQGDNQSVALRRDLWVRVDAYGLLDRVANPKAMLEGLRNDFGFPLTTSVAVAARKRSQRDNVMGWHVRVWAPFREQFRADMRRSYPGPLISYERLYDSWYLDERIAAIDKLISVVHRHFDVLLYDDAETATTTMHRRQPSSPPAAAQSTGHSHGMEGQVSPSNPGAVEYLNYSASAPTSTMELNHQTLPAHLGLTAENYRRRVALYAAPSEPEDAPKFVAVQDLQPSDDAPLWLTHPRSLLRISFHRGRVPEYWVVGQGIDPTKICNLGDETVKEAASAVRRSFHKTKTVNYFRTPT